MTSLRAQTEEKAQKVKRLKEKVEMERIALDHCSKNFFEFKNFGKK